jgi:adenylylsulfate reductase, subunit B
MPTFVLLDKCKGCMECVRLCPSDIMHIDATLGKAYNAEPAMCWECYCCVKACPETAVDVRGYADFAPLGHRVTQVRTADRIEWRIESRGGAVREFVFPIRTTPWGSIPSPAALPPPEPEAVRGQLLSLEPDYLGVEALPTVLTKGPTDPP